jgi:hypothetical protein
MNPIENVWGDMVKEFTSQQRTKDQVFEQAKNVWEWL